MTQHTIIHPDGTSETFEEINQQFFDPVSQEYFDCDPRFYFVPETAVSVPSSRPSIIHIWDIQAATWVLSQDRLDKLKQAKLLQINTERDVSCLQDVTSDNHLWQADAKSQLLLTQAISLAQAGLPLPAVWRDADNNDVAITDIAQLLAIAAAIAAQTQAAYQKAWQLKDAIIAATTLEEIEAITR